MSPVLIDFGSAARFNAQAEFKTGQGFLGGGGGYSRTSVCGGCYTIEGCDRIFVNYVNVIFPYFFSHFYIIAYSFGVEALMGSRS